MQDLTWQDIESYVEEREDPTAIVPIGSTEQHGPHLPLGVDAYQAIGIAEESAEAADVLTAPPIWYGDANHHLAFPGTLSLSTQTVIAVLKDVYESLIHHGFTNVVTVNGHRLANLPAIEIASKQTKEEHPDTFFATVDLVRAAVRLHRELREGDEEAGFHGGEFETSFIMARHPELVKEEEIQKSEDTSSWTRFASNDYVNIDDSIQTASARQDWADDAMGHQGDPTYASPEKGEELIAGIVANVVEFLEDVDALRAAQRSDTDESLGLTY
jgi:creatinine amidohydrolase